MKNNSMFNKTQHQENTDEEKFADAQHAALSKMMQGSPEMTAPAPVAAVPPAPPVPALKAPAGVPGAVVAPPSPFPGLHAALSKYATAPGPSVEPAAMKIAPAAPRKPFQRRI